MCHCLHLVRWDIEIDDRRTPSNVLQEVNGVGPIVFVPRVVNYADITLPVYVDVLLGKLQGGHLTLSVELLILVSPLPIELLRRCP